jgi:hypothetical protein
VAGRPYTFEHSVPAATGGPDFLPRLWATRKVGYLLDEIRLHGEDDELVDEIVALSKRYGIITPYTSFLILEDEPSTPGLVDGEFGADSGAGAVRAAEDVSGYTGADNTTKVQSEEVRYVGDRTFFQRQGYWQDSLHPEGQPTQDLEFGSPRYFELLAREPGVGPLMALGTQVIFVWEARSYRVLPAATAVQGLHSGATPSSPVLEQNEPNPFNAGTLIPFVLPTRARVHLAVYDLAGQRVAELVDEVMPAGPHAVRWDGRSARGTAAASGTYVYRLAVSGMETARKLVLVK